MDLPADAMKPKDKLKTIEKVIQPTPQKSINSLSVLILSSSSMSNSNSKSSILMSTTQTKSPRTLGATKPANAMPTRSNSFVQSRIVKQVNKSNSGNSYSAGLLRSKSFVQTKSQPQTAKNKLQSLIMRTPKAKNSPNSSTGTFVRPGPPGPPCY